MEGQRRERHSSSLGEVLAEGGLAPQWQKQQQGPKFHGLTGENQINKVKGREMGQRWVHPVPTGWPVQNTGLLSEGTNGLFGEEKSRAGRWGRRRRIRNSVSLSEKKKV